MMKKGGSTTPPRAIVIRLAGAAAEMETKNKAKSFFELDPRVG